MDGGIRCAIPPYGLLREIVWLNGQPLAIATTRTGSSTQELFWYHNDHLSTPQRVTDATGAVVWDAIYEPFGTVTLSTALITQPLRMPGQPA